MLAYDLTHLLSRHACAIKGDGGIII